jgi:hypothetical protein
MFAMSGASLVVNPSASSAARFRAPVRLGVDARHADLDADRHDRLL